MKKVFDVFVIVLFSIFAYLQLNDGDGSKWILLYGAVVILGLASLLNKIKSLYPLFIFSFLLGYLFFNIELVTSWIDAGKPAFIDYEPTNIQAVENIREFLGLLICLVVSGVYYLLYRSK